MWLTLIRQNGVGTCQWFEMAENLFELPNSYKNFGWQRLVSTLLKHNWSIWLPTFGELGILIIVFKFSQMWSVMTLNYWMMVERYPNLTEEVGGLIPGCEIFSLLDRNMVLACWPSVSKKKSPGWLDEIFLYQISIIDGGLHAISRAITMFCRTDNILWNIPLFRLNDEYSTEYCQPCKTMLWLWIILCHMFETHNIHRATTYITFRSDWAYL